MFQRLFLLFVGLVVFSSPIHTQVHSEMVEVFDIEKGTVIHEIIPNPIIQEEAKFYAANIDSLYKKINPLPPNGLIVRIPLDPPQSVQNQWFHALLDEINIIYPENGNPYVMLYDDENHIYFFNIHTKLDYIHFLFYMTAFI